MFIITNPYQIITTYNEMLNELVTLHSLSVQLSKNNANTNVRTENIPYKIDPNNNPCCLKNSLAKGFFSILNGST